MTAPIYHPRTRTGRWWAVAIVAGRRCWVVVDAPGAA